MPQPGGTQKAAEIHIFPEAMRGTGEGHRPWDLLPNSTMTNATVANEVANSNGKTLILKYKDGEKTFAVSPNVTVGRFLIALIFVRAGINKLGSIAATSATMGSHGIPYPDLLVWGAVVVEIGGGLLLILGLFTRWAALALFFYTLALALIFHAYWTATGAAVRTESAGIWP